MKILLITPFFYPSLAGVETYVLNLSKNLALNGHDVTVLTLNTENSSDSEEVFPNVFVKRCYISFNYSKGFLSLEFLKFMFNAKEYDVYHVHIPFSFGLEVATIASKINKINLVVTHHGEGPLKNNIHIQTAISKIYNVFSRIFVLNFADNIIFLTKSYCRSLFHTSITKKKIKIIRTGSNIEKFNLKKRDSVLKEKMGFNDYDKIILFVGSLSKYNRYKGVNFLIKSIKNVSKKYDNVKLLIVGDGELIPELKQLCEKENIPNKVTFAGAIPNDMLPLYYGISDIFVLPSIHGPENSPMVLFEAMASSKPIIATDLPGVKDIVEDSFGLRIPPKDINKLSSAIELLVKDDGLREKMGIQARINAEKYSWKDCANEMEKIYLKN